MVSPKSLLGEGESFPPRIEKQLMVTDSMSEVLLTVQYQFASNQCPIEWKNQSLIVWKHGNWMMEMLIDGSKYHFLINGIEKASASLGELPTKNIRILVKPDSIWLYFPQNQSEYQMQNQMDLRGEHSIQLMNSFELRVIDAQFDITRTNNSSLPLNNSGNRPDEMEKQMICDWNQKLKNGINQILTDLDQIKTTSPPSSNRTNFCQLSLENNCPTQLEKQELVYLTPEISYMQKKRNCHLIQKNNIGIKYNHSNTMNQICIVNPLANLRAFFCDFVVKNLILFGLIVLFCLLLGDPNIPAWPTGVIIAAVVVAAYNLIYLLFKVIENIFTFACRYGVNVSDYVGDDQWTNI